MTDIQAKPRRIEDDPHVLEVYGNKLINASYDGGAVVITIGATRFVPDQLDDAPQQTQHAIVHVTARLAISPSAAVELVNVLNNILGAITKKTAHEAIKQEAMMAGL